MKKKDTVWQETSSAKKGPALLDRIASEENLRTERPFEYEAALDMVEVGIVKSIEEYIKISNKKINQLNRATLRDYRARGGQTALSV